MLRHPRSTLIPYTTLFRSAPVGLVLHCLRDALVRCTPGICQFVAGVGETGASGMLQRRLAAVLVGLERKTLERCQRVARSEEHTSELQSPCKIVCLLLLDK